MKKIIMGLIIVGVMSVWAPIKSEAALDLPIRSIAGTVFQDINENGVLDSAQLEIGLKNKTVTLFKTLSQAEKDEQPIKTVTTNSLGGYAFTSLKQGEYFLKYNKIPDQFKVIGSEKAAVNSQGEKISNIIPVKVDDKKLAFMEDLPLSRITNLTVTPFNDYNWNGIREEKEEVINGKTMIILDINLFSKTYSEGRLGTINAASVISGALVSGNVDLIDGIYLRTTKDGQAIQLPDVKSGAYMVVRSPFNLTMGDLMTNQEVIKAIITVLQNGDVSSLLANNELLSTGDIDTNNDNEYLKKMASGFSRLAEEAEKINIKQVLGASDSTIATQVSNQFKQLSGLLTAFPSFRLGVVNYFGDSYDVTGLKLKRTNDFLFGIRNFATIMGNVYLDLDNNGSMGSLELSGADSQVNVYDERGNELASSITTSIARGYKFSDLPYDTPLYVTIQTDRPVSPLLNQQEVPAILATHKVVGKYVIAKEAINPVVTQQIGVMSSVPNSVSAILQGTNTETLEAMISFKNTDKLNGTTVYYTLNSGKEFTVTLNRAPLIGTVKPVVVNVPLLLNSGENRLQGYWKSGVYKITLPDIRF